MEFLPQPKPFGKALAKLNHLDGERANNEGQVLELTGSFIQEQLGRVDPDEVIISNTYFILCQMHDMLPRSSHHAYKTILENGPQWRQKARHGGALTRFR